MITDGRVLGLPLVDYTNTTANIEALTSLEAGMTAYSTDDSTWGYYDGADWQWWDTLVPETRTISVVAPLAVDPVDGVLDDDLTLSIDKIGVPIRMDVHGLTMDLGFEMDNGRLLGYNE